MVIISFLLLLSMTLSHKLSDFNIQMCRLSVLWVKSSKGILLGQSESWQCCVPSGSSRRASVSLPLPASRGCPHSWFVPPFHLQSQQGAVESFSHGLTLTLTSAFLFHLYELSWFHWAHWMIQIISPSPNLQLNQSAKSQSGHLWAAIILTTKVVFLLPGEFTSLLWRLLPKFLSHSLRSYGNVTIFMPHPLPPTQGAHFSCLLSPMYKYLSWSTYLAL